VGDDELPLVEEAAAAKPTMARPEMTFDAYIF
jgi:hypothetical protein